MAILIGSTAAAAAVPSSNAQLWGEVDVTLPVAGSLSATALGVARDGEGLPNPAVAGGGLTLDARSGAWTFTIGDLVVAARSAKTGATTDINLPLTAVALGGTIAGFRISNRNRIEQLQGAPGGPWRYRNRLQIEHPLMGAGPLTSVFASNEAFYDFAQQRWTRNRAQVGGGLGLRAGQQIQVYYLRQDDGLARPGALNVLGLTYKVDLR